MESLNPQVVSAAKLPISNLNEFNLWKIRIEQYFLVTDYSLWEVILNGDSPAPTRVIEGVLQLVAPTTAEQRLARKNELKARDLEEQSLDDLFNSLKIYEAEVKSFSSASTTTQNIAFVSSSNTDNTNEPVSVAASVSAVSVKIPVSPLPNVDSLSNAVINSFFASQSNSPQLDNDDLKQIDSDDLEEMYLKWQMDMLTVRARWKGHFARKSRYPNDTRRNGAAEPQRRNSFQAEEEPTNYALMAFSSLSSSSDNELSPTKPDNDLSHTYRPSAPIIEDWVSDSMDESETKTPQNVLSFVQPSEQVKSPRPSVQHVETSISPANSKTVIPKPTCNGKRRNRKACFVCKSLDHLIKDCDYHEKKMAQHTARNHAKRGTHKHYAQIPFLNPHRHVVPAAVLTQSNLIPITAVRPVSTADIPNINVTRPRQDQPIVSKPTSPTIRHINSSPSPKVSNSPPRVTAVKAPMVNAAKEIQVSDGLVPKEKLTILFFMLGNPQHALKDKGIIDSGCSRHMTGNMSYLSEFEELNGRYVAFGETQRVMCDKKNSVLFTDTECLVLSLEFKLSDESQVLLRVPRENNMYNNTDEDVAFDEKEPESKVNVSPSSSAQSKKHNYKTKREGKGKSHVKSLTGYRNLSAEFEDYSDNSINEDNAAGTMVLAVGQISPNSTNTFSAAGPSKAAASPTHGKSSCIDTSQLLDDPDMLELEDITYSTDEDDVGAEADFNNLETSITVSPIPTTRVHKDHLVTQIIGDLSYATQTKSMTRVAKDQGFKDPDYPDKVCKVVKAFYGLHQAPRAWYETLDNYLLENGFQRDKIDQTLFIKRRKGVNTPRSDEDILELMELTVFLLPSEEKVRIKVSTVDLQVSAFWNSVAVKKVNDVTQLQALVDKKKLVITKASIRDVLRLDDTEGIECLPNEKIFAELARIGYEKPSTKLAFYKAFFLSQWKFLIDTILQCMSAKRTSWNEFSSSMASAVICLYSGIKFNFSKYIFNSLVRNVDSTTKFYLYLRFLQVMIRKQVGDLSSHSTKYTSPALTQKVFANMRRLDKGFSGVKTLLFEGMIVEQQVDEGDAEVNVDDVNAVGVIAEGVVSASDDEVPTADEERFIPSPTLPTPPPQPSQDIPSTSQYSEQDKVAQALEITKLKSRVNKLERRNKASKLKRLKKVGSPKRIDTSDDTVMDDVSKQGGIIANIDADEDVVLEDAKDGQDADVLSMQEEELKLAKLQEVVYVVTTSKIITEVVTATSTTITVADVPIPAVTTAAASTLTAAPSRRRKGVVIRDPEETTTSSTIIHSEAKSKDKGKGILVEEPKPLKKLAQIKQDKKYARELEAELNKTIDWDKVIDHMQRKQKQDKMDYFKGMTYDDICPIFEKHFDSNVAFLQKTKKQMDEEDSRALKRLNESKEDKAAEKQKLDGEVKELKRHLQIVPNDDDDVYTEATPLARKVLVVDYEIYNENNKPYYKIKRANDTHQLYISFLSMLRNFDREVLEVLWQSVKERFATTKPKNFFDDFLLITLRAMFKKPDIHAQTWRNQRSVHGQAKVKS
uniref:Ribonuclease H-like domain-containing protein n=1 Tax=Tanacetum cinerariifolium TaxID=118510 RepID=A0A6L2LV50_TANCI|nr:ribonuclease H-like domain-containing protein [Tanacetum cinerariifolium]